MALVLGVIVELAVGVVDVAEDVDPRLGVLWRCNW